MGEIHITPELPQVSTDPKGADIPWEAKETAPDAPTAAPTDTKTDHNDLSGKQIIEISPRPEVERKAPERRIFSWSDYGLNKWMKARTRKRNSVRKTQEPRSAGRTFGEARSSTC